MALLSVEKRKAIFQYLGLGEYTKANIKAFQKKYMLRKSDWDGIYGQNTDNTLRTVYFTKVYCKDFEPEEFRCECGGKYCCGYPSFMKPAMLKHIQAIRDHYNEPIIVTCGLRDKTWNGKLGGSIQNSLHMQGLAVDFFQSGVTDPLAKRKSSIKWIAKQKNHHYTYGNGIYRLTTDKTYSGSVSAPYMGNCLHTDVYDNVKPTYPKYKEPEKKHETPDKGTSADTDKKTDKKPKTVQQKIVAYAKKMAKDAYFHYVHWKKNDPKTKKCPICHDVPKTSKYYGTYCTIFPILCWHHGGGIKIKCDKAPNNGQIERIYNAKTDAEALRLARLYFGIKDIKVIRNKKGIPQKRLQAGDSCYYFRGSTCQHAFLYIGDGKMIDANSYKDKAKQIAVRKAMSCKVAVRYVGK